MALPFGLVVIDEPPRDIPDELVAQLLGTGSLLALHRSAAASYDALACPCVRVFARRTSARAARV
eukprot:1185976-Prorocentrum_minimum.AAC.4